MCVCSLDSNLLPDPRLFHPHSPLQLTRTHTHTHIDSAYCLRAAALILPARLLVTCWHVFIWPCMVN